MVSTFVWQLGQARATMCRQTHSLTLQSLDLVANFTPSRSHFIVAVLPVLWAFLPSHPRQFSSTPQLYRG
jgi:hypothetical protein